MFNTTRHKVRIGETEKSGWGPYWPVSKDFLDQWIFVPGKDSTLLCAFKEKKESQRSGLALIERVKGRDEMCKVAVHGSDPRGHDKTLGLSWRVTWLSFCLMILVALWKLDFRRVREEADWPVGGLLFGIFLGDWVKNSCTWILFWFLDCILLTAIL